ncbi:hypothetical protein SpiGrapes_1362 [Sphaerochaeta pleomorpha str. Grapes]|uniref:Uncharacterized protein n=1 Tax=Sphaerochaeta pleomorpha (strain ATCC BAA-1885 / DSM 22778 / Grapes) TaxID=158190 RepID=G8QUE2_SPHPG|nr:DUF6657 family protein [Sphaerochaeta pleomorpha]AEV29175.1 hypothetical protein SpiGrapes_1362 [Sphaerochaeta pleomorpha str. Grapes]
MAFIKSAWELALEKTETLQVDPEKIKHDLKVKEGRQLAAAFLMDIDITKEETLEKFSAYPAEEQKAVTEGMALTLLANLTLPRTEKFQESFAKITELGNIIAPENEDLTSLMGQLEAFFSQYFKNQEDMIERMKQQFAPQLEQKQAQLRQQYGPNFMLRPEQDPEFMKLLDKNLSQLDTQYNNILMQAKNQIKGILNIE